MLMVLEYVDGGSLFAGTKISPKKRLTELAARKYFRDVLQVLLITPAPQLTTLLWPMKCTSQCQAGLSGKLTAHWMTWISKRNI